MAKSVRLICPFCGEVSEYPALSQNGIFEFFCPCCGKASPSGEFLPERSAPAMAQIRYSTTAESSDNGRSFPLRSGDNIIGRKPLGGPPKADIAIATQDMGFSRSHLCIRQEGSKYSVFLTESKNYTFVNGLPLVQGDVKPLKNGDRIETSTSVLEFSCPDDNSTIIK